MNLHAIVSPAIAAVSPFVTLTIMVSGPPIQNADGTRTPTYSPVALIADVQGIDAEGLRMMESLNLQGISRRVWVNGQYDGIVRAAAKGGDVVIDQAGTRWLITAVPEGWDTSGWCSFIMTMQNGG